MRVIVVGAGIIGCSVAYELSSRGARVTMIDMRRPGEGATSASAGILAPHIESHSPEFLQLSTASLSMYDAFIERVRADSGCDVEYRRSGTLEVALTDDQNEHLNASAATYRARGVEHVRLDAEDLRALEPGIAATAAGALLVPSHGLVAAGQLTSALAAILGRRGAVILADRRVDRVTADAGEAGGRVSVICGAETFTADTVVIAAGSWSGQIEIARVPRPPVKPIRGQLLHLACGSAPTSHVLWGTDCYLVPWQDGTLLVGATVEDVGFDERATVAGVRDLLDAACELLPAAWSARFQGVRVGLRPATPDGLPIVGRASALPNVVYATGHYRNGVLLAPITAAATAELVLDGRSRPELELTRPARVGL